jgi:hypothetical protein
MLGWVRVGWVGDRLGRVGLGWVELSWVGVGWVRSGWSAGAGGRRRAFVCVESLDSYISGPPTSPEHRRSSSSHRSQARPASASQGSLEVVRPGQTANRTPRCLTWEMEQFARLVSEPLQSAPSTQIGDNVEPGGKVPPCTAEAPGLGKPRLRQTTTAAASLQSSASITVKPGDRQRQAGS